MQLLCSGAGEKEKRVISGRNHRKFSDGEFIEVRRAPASLSAHRLKLDRGGREVILEDQVAMPLEGLVQFSVLGEIDQMPSLIEKLAALAGKKILPGKAPDAEDGSVRPDAPRSFRADLATELDELVPRFDFFRIRNAKIIEDVLIVDQNRSPDIAGIGILPALVSGRVSRLGPTILLRGESRWISRDQ